MHRLRARATHDQLACILHQAGMWAMQSNRCSSQNEKEKLLYQLAWPSEFLVSAESGTRKMESQAKTFQRERVIVTHIIDFVFSWTHTHTHAHVGSMWNYLARVNWIAEADRVRVEMISNRMNTTFSRIRWNWRSTEIRWRHFLCDDAFGFSAPNSITKSIRYSCTYACELLILFHQRRRAERHLSLARVRIFGGSSPSTSQPATWIFCEFSKLLPTAFTPHESNCSNIFFGENATETV